MMGGSSFSHNAGMILGMLLAQMPPLPKGDLRDVKPPVDYPVDYVVFGVIDVFLIVALIGLIYVMRRFLQGMRKPLVLPAWSQAFRQLSELQQQQKPDKEYYFQVTAILRHYIEVRFAVKAPEMTTQEFLQSLKKGCPIPSRQEAILEDFLQQCDLIKFANVPVTRLDRQKAMAMVRQFIDETKDDI
jgi:hypothetical protein